MPGRDARLDGLIAGRIPSLVAATLLGVACGGTAPTSCGSSAECPARTFCGEASHLCVSEVVQVAGGAHHSCARHADGRVSCWGLAESIHAGGGQVEGPAPVQDVDGAVSISAGNNLTCAVTRTALRCWGDRRYDVLRDDGGPLFPVSAVALGSIFGCAIAADGTRCWGQNTSGQLARPLSLTDSASALLSAPGTVRFLGAGEAAITHDGASRACAWGDNRSKQVTAADAAGVYTSPECGTLDDVVELTVGDVHACVRHGKGSFSCWGERYYGQLGLGGDDTADVAPYGSDTSLSAPVATLVAGVSHTCALLVDGAVNCFGRNELGEVGPGANTSAEEVRTPAVVSGFAGRVIALGAGSSARHTCAILAGGSVQCWGSDEAGQLGDGVTAIEMGRHSNGPVTVRF